MEDSGLRTPGGTLYSNADISNLLKDRDKAKEYIKNCKEIMHKQSDQLKTQQNKFKTTLTNIESQHNNQRFHAIGIKLELETHKIFMTFRKRASLLKAQAFYLFRDKVRNADPHQARAFLKLGVQLLDQNLRKVNAFALRIRFNKWQSFAMPDPETLNQKIILLDKQVQELRSHKPSSKNSVLQKILEIQQENDMLKEKIKRTEQSVGLFVGEMGKLLDQHEPPGFKEYMEKQQKKAKRQSKPTIKTRLRHSPDYSGERSSAKRSSEFNRVNFD